MGEWITKSMFELGTTYTGLSGKKKDDFGEGEPYVTYLNVFHNCKVRLDLLDFVRIKQTERQNKIQKGDALFTTSSETPEEVGMSSVVTDDIIQNVYLNSFCFGYRLKNPNEIKANFLAYLLRGHNFRKQMLIAAQGSTRHNLSKKNFYSSTVLFPVDVNEQEKISQILSTIDAAIAKTKAIIEKYKSIKEGLMQDLLVNGIDENGVIRSQKTHKYKDSPLGKIPVEWDVFSLLDITEKIADRDHTTPVYVKSGVPIISPKDFDEDENISFEKCSYISYEAHLINRKKTDIKPLDIIFTRIGAGLGKSCVVTETMPEFSILHSAALIRANNKVLPYFLMYAMKSFYFQKQIYNGIQSIGVPDLGIDKIAELSVKMPKDKKEQDRIQIILNSIAEKILSEKSTLDKLLNLKMGLMQDLLTHKVSVDPLLERSVENE